MYRCEIVRRYYNLMYNEDIENSFDIESNILELINTKRDKEMIIALVYHDMKHKKNITRKSISIKYGLTDKKARNIYDMFSLVKL